MDWFSWLSKTGLDPSLVYDYGLAFVNNELEEEDIRYFDHEFLQSMGISIAKHRLEILKLARKEKGSSSRFSPRSISRFLVAIKRTKRYLTKYVRTWVHQEKSALVVVPRPPYSSNWRGAMLKRNRKLTPATSNSKSPRLLLTNGSASIDYPVVYALSKEDKADVDDGYWSNGVEEIRWDTMFQDLKPT
ncbi:hypothetical protein ACJRO7_005875 [Eucalyptus globulus]|uniref:SAM domain-containing protein n=1 Tax=Eucalyptus globulus TaxID=34317 RepID=A0ABD3J1C0_EUCGL